MYWRSSILKFTRRYFFSLTSLHLQILHVIICWGLLI
uniref:Uncharacterized protein n=1 Tax=Lepeophtheirus salmonis TaxID=72036 RepID=A0A0K2UUW8_LEPSM